MSDVPRSQSWVSNGRTHSWRFSTLYKIRVCSARYVPRRTAGINGTGHFGKFGTTSIPVPDTSVPGRIHHVCLFGTSTTKLCKLIYACRRPRWLGMCPRAYKISSWQVSSRLQNQFSRGFDSHPVHIHVLVGTLSCKKIYTSGNRESVSYYDRDIHSMKIDERWEWWTLSWRHVPGRRADTYSTCDHGLSTRPLRVKPPTSCWKVKVFLFCFLWTHACYDGRGSLCKTHVTALGVRMQFSDAPQNHKLHNTFCICIRIHLLCLSHPTPPGRHTYVPTYQVLQMAARKEAQSITG